MNCHEVEREIAGGERLTDEARDHLFRCPACQRFAQISCAAQGATGPSKEVDAGVLSVWRRHALRARRFWQRVLLPAAAAAVVVLSLCWYAGGGAPVPRERTESVEIDAETVWQTEWTVTDQELGKLEMLLACE